MRFAGQITGVEGYIESCAMGLVAARFAAGRAAGPPGAAAAAEIAMGALYHHVTRARAAQRDVRADEHQLRPAAAARRASPTKRDRRRLYASRALDAFAGWCGVRRPCGRLSVSTIAVPVPMFRVWCALAPAGLAGALVALLTAVGCTRPNTAFTAWRARR